MIDPKLFTVERLLATLLDDCFGNVDAWRKHASIVVDWMPRFPQPDTKPICVVRIRGVRQDNESFLRYSKGPRQGFHWDVYPDHMLTPEVALVALLSAPVPPWLVKNYVLTSSAESGR